VKLFVAVEIGQEVQHAASRVIEELRRRTGQSAPRARVTWVKPEQLHITVRFIGHVDAAMSERLLAALERPLDVPAFSLAIEGTGTFPPKRPSRVIWAGVTVGLDQLREVEREVGVRLEPLISSVIDRDYHPHVTLGRVKIPVGLRPAVLLEGLEDTGFGVVQVGAVTLFESRLSSTGPTYVALGRTELARVS
jgi:RNA 2',3'-cyclic 3'-phosphodiesterase